MHLFLIKIFNFGIGIYGQGSKEFDIPVNYQQKAHKSLIYNALNFWR